jgi:hypothetical protein
VCRELAPEEYEVEKRLGGKVREPTGAGYTVLNMRISNLFG